MSPQTHPNLPNIWAVICGTELPLYMVEVITMRNKGFILILALVFILLNNSAFYKTILYSYRGDEGIDIQITLEEVQDWDMIVILAVNEGLRRSVSEIPVFSDEAITEINLNIQGQVDEIIIRVVRYKEGERQEKQCSFSIEQKEDIWFFSKKVGKSLKSKKF